MRRITQPGDLCFLGSSRDHDLNALRDRTSLSCHLSIHEQTDSLYLYRAFAAQRLSVNIPIGTRIPCHCTVMGRMLLTSLNEAQRKSVLNKFHAGHLQIPISAHLRWATYR